jgi:hypothetical protein
MHSCGVNVRKLAIGVVAGVAIVAILMVVLAVGIRLGRDAGPVASAPAPSAPPPVPSEPAIPSPTPDQVILSTWAFEGARLDALTGPILVHELYEWAGPGPWPTYAQLQRNAEAHRREKAVFVGEILEIHDMPSGGSYMRLATRGYEDVLWVETVRNAPEALVARSRVRAYGYLMGTKSYSSQAGWQMTIPQMAAVAVVPASTPTNEAR